MGRGGRGGEGGGREGAAVERRQRPTDAAARGGSCKGCAGSGEGGGGGKGGGRGRGRRREGGGEVKLGCAVYSLMSYPRRPK